MAEQTGDPTSPRGRRARLTAPGSGLALCGFGIRPAGRRPFPRGAGLCAHRPEQQAAPEQGQHPDSAG